VPTLELTVLLTQDGVLLPDYPVIRRLVVDEAFPSDLTLAAGGTVVLPLGGMAVRAALVVRSLDQPVTAALGTVTLNAGGLVIVFDGIANATSVHNATVSPTAVQALGGGSA